MTPKQASRALAALDGLQYHVELYAEIGRIDYKPYIWQQEALFRLRGHLISMLPEGDPQLVPAPLPEGNMRKRTDFDTDQVKTTDNRSKLEQMPINWEELRWASDE